LTEPPQAELEAGMEVYASTSLPCEARLKSADEDFLVEEEVALEGLSRSRVEGYLPVYRVKKRSVDTMHMEREVASLLKSRVSVGGLKDKRAVSVQYLTPVSVRSLDPPSVSGSGFEAERVGYVPRPFGPSSVRGNRFTVVLRECCREVGAAIEETAALAEARRIPNYYGLQRFGSRGAGSHLVGRALVSLRFEDACKTLLCSPRRGDSDATKEARKALAAGRYGEGSRLLPPGQEVERLVAKRLAKDPTGYVRALREVPIRLRRLYVQAYQSFLFNRTLSEAMKESVDISKYSPGDNWCEEVEAGLSPVRGVRDPPRGRPVPMVQVAGYAFRDYRSRFDRCLRKVMEDEGVRPAQFYVKEMQEVSAEGGFRRPHMAVAGLTWEARAGEANLRFLLGRGQYATVLLREVVKPRDPEGSGFA
jgi:tRNA pseudouridine13 synthase